MNIKNKIFIIFFYYLFFILNYYLKMISPLKVNIMGLDYKYLFIKWYLFIIYLRANVIIVIYSLLLTRCCIKCII